jgi:adenylyl-sulfate kinase
MQTPGVVVWLTGLPCSGKSTLARGLVDALAAKGRPCEILDGDVVRTHLSYGLGFSRKDRDVNVSRIGFVAGLLAKHGVTVVVAAVSPYRQARDAVRQAVGQRFVEVYVDAPLAVCEERDVKGMYAQARSGKLSHFTGVDDPYEAPLAAELTVKTEEQNVRECLDAILALLHAKGYLVD